MTAPETGNAPAATVRGRIEAALAGDPVEWPVYAAYDWFIENRAIDWPRLFEAGLGQINHANLVEIEYPHREISVRESVENGRTRRDVHWTTEIGELHEWYLDGWRQDHFIKAPDDYRILAHAFSDARIRPTDEAFLASEARLGYDGLTLGQLGPMPLDSRTPPQRIQIDFAGLERFAVDVACETPELQALIDVMTEQLIEACRLVRSSRARYIKLWENLEVESLGPDYYRRHLVPIYRRVFDAFDGTDKKILVHYDGKLSLIADDIRDLPFDGLDSLTPPPEGDVEIDQARVLWPDKFFWLHPSLGWFSRPEPELRARIQALVKAAGPTRFCLQLSEEVPDSWSETIPAVLRALEP